MALTHERARDVLREIIDDAEAPLASLERHHHAREAAQAAATAELRRFDDTPEGDRLRRLQLRDTRALLRNVGRLREARRKGYSLPKPPPAPRRTANPRAPTSAPHRGPHRRPPRPTRSVPAGRRAKRGLPAIRRLNDRRRAGRSQAPRPARLRRT